MIKGLKYIPSFISLEEEIKLIFNVDSQPWLKDLKRRTQHYGYKYDYTKKTIDSSLYLGKIPFWLDSYCYKLADKGIFKSVPNQVIVNEYQPGQGISKHVDCVGCFGETVASLSLNSACVMHLENRHTGLAGEIALAPLSLLVLSDEARYDWLHSIPARTSDMIANQSLPRGRRISLTFRTVLL